METTPRPVEGAHWDQPPRQRATVRIQKRVGLERLTPVFGTAQPPRGVSGLLRRAAYRIPEHRARHWALLLLADRVDVVERRLGDQVRRRPALFGLIAAAAIGGLGRTLRQRRRC